MSARVRYPMTRGPCSGPSLDGSEWVLTKAFMAPWFQLSCWGVQSWMGMSEFPAHWAIVVATSR